MRLNKTLSLMREVNKEQGTGITIYGAKKYERILNFKAVKGCNIIDGIREFQLVDGSWVWAYYSDIESR